MITFENVTKVYSDETVAIEDINFEVERGTTTVFVGPSGCGKTTTMTLVNRLEEPTEGTVYYDGRDVQELETVELRRNIGYVIQEIGLFDHMTVGDNIATVPELRGWERERIDDRVDELLELMDLPPGTYRDQYPTALSGGQQQRVGVARALAADPDVILMDEPFGALDPITRAELQDEFLEIQERIDTTILFVTHDLDEALKMGDKIAVFDVGELVQYGTPREILENPANDFVEEFIGDNRTLKELQITPVEEIMRPESDGRGAQPTAVDGGAADTEAVALPDVTVSPTDSAEIALSRMIETDTKALQVVDDGDTVGLITERDIRNWRTTTEVGA
ncbi:MULTISPECIES: ABC transporter ATP-binding protein [unclassified Haladaptatus]|uniref:ABC transporter ATP-binding protein n=1 Tax=unclassified Haladaptatus TaxID=2622732 RepID=UPI00209C24F6|nr:MULTISPECIES: ABC transporter ATP-binding protein [unclassified Haladaptatus]MCO8243427.1 ABC transporter ATP-binding protein [Haladaptatus sp. AB643]MCO8254834.1 ABC transporter ATP-binding protein [Haladaptatus sp. AB618]